MNLAKESIYSIIFQILGFFCAAVAGIIIARTLGPADKGVVALSLLYPSFYATMFSLTVGLGILHHMGRKEYDLKSFAGTALVVLVIASVASLSVYFVSILAFRQTLYKGVAMIYLIAGGISIPFYLMLYYFSSVLQGDKDIQGYNLSNQLIPFANLFLVLIFTISSRLIVMTAIIAGISGILLGGMLSLLKVYRKAGGLHVSRTLAVELIRDSAKLHLGGVATFISFNQANLFILNYYASPREVGYYSVSYGIAIMLFFFTTSLEAGLYPKVAHATMEEAAILVRKAVKQMLYITGIVAVCIGLFSKHIVVLYGGKDFLPAATPLLFLLPGTVIYTIPKMLSPLWLRKGWFFPITAIAGSTAALSIVFNFVLIPKFGANGAAAATTLTYFFSCAIGLYLYWKHVSKDVAALFVPVRDDINLYRDMMNNVVVRFSRSRYQ
jgi:O-antigen/teichoic acid export membrane protein